MNKKTKNILIVVLFIVAFLFILNSFKPLTIAQLLESYNFNRVGSFDAETETLTFRVSYGPVNIADPEMELCVGIEYDFLETFEDPNFQTFCNALHGDYLHLPRVRYPNHARCFFGEESFEYFDSLEINEEVSYATARGNRYDITEGSNFRQLCFLKPAEAGWRHVSISYYVEIAPEVFVCEDGEERCEGFDLIRCVDNEWINLGAVVENCGVDCIEGDRCEDRNYFVCENYRWQNRGEVVGQCGVEEPSEEPETVCGNNICEVDETFENCPEDCEVPEEPPIEPILLYALLIGGIGVLIFLVMLIIKKVGK